MERSTKVYLYHMVFMLSAVQAQATHFTIAKIDEQNCQLDLVSSKTSKITCALKCNNKNKTPVFKDGSCHCTSGECIRNQQQQQQQNETSSLVFLPIPERECFPADFTIEFLRPTQNVPVLQEKEIFIKNEMTFAVWFNIVVDENGHYDHLLFTMPRDFTKQNAIIQGSIYGGKRIYFDFNQDYGQAPTTPTNSFQNGEWTHLAVTCLQTSSSTVKYIFYKNGEAFYNTVQSGKVLQLPEGEPLKGFVLGNDVDDSDINDPNQYFAGKLSDLHIYNKVLSPYQIRESFVGRHPTENKVLSWEEFRGKAIGPDSKQIDCTN